MSKGPREDLTGQKFREWEVLEYIGSGKWRCRCSCNKEKVVQTTSLTSGKSKSCGHNSTAFKDLTGKQFGEWTVLYYLGNQKWKCKCSCGEDGDVETYNLTSYKSKSCGHNSNNANINKNIDRTFKDLTGKKIGEWEVLEYKGKSMWKCKCSCGKEKNVHRYSLLSGSSNSCGHGNVNDLTGQRFGRLTAIKYMGKHIWKCKCDCGNETEVYTANLHRGGTQSCGCIVAEQKLTKEFIVEKLEEFIRVNREKPYILDVEKMLNRGETVTRRYLKEYNLETYINRTYKSRYERDIRDLLSDNNKIITNIKDIIDNRELDILLPNKKIAIEFNGSYWHSEKYKDISYHIDKTRACEDKGIRLIHIFEYEWLNIDKHLKLIELLKKFNVDKYKDIKQTEFRIVNNNIAKEYNMKNNIYNHINCNTNIAVYKDNDIISMTSVNIINNKECEILRHCNNIDYSAKDILNKIIKILTEELKMSTIKVKVNLDKFSGKTYKDIGFKELNKIKPDYIWVEPYKNVVVSRIQSQKHNLIEMKLGNEEDSEEDIMHRLGYLKVYDCGKSYLIYSNEINNFNKISTIKDLI